MDADVRSLLMSLAMGSGSNTNPLMQMILAQNGVNNDGTSNIDLQDIISRLKEKDPVLAIIAQQLLKKDQEVIESEDYTLLDDEEEDNSRKLDESFYRLSKKVEIMQNELEQLREINKFCAAALGACYLCWGSDPTCQICEGTGQSGAFTPDREYFRELVVPACRRVIKNRNRKNNQERLSDKLLAKIIDK